MERNQTIISIQKVTKRFDKVIAVADLSLEIPRGEVFGFLGPNGAGKTTTIKMLVGLTRPTTGTIYIDGIDIQAEPEKAKLGIGYVPDNPFLYEKLTGREFLKFVGGLYRLDENEIAKRIEWLFDLFSVTEWGDERTEGYSHGMKQKIVISSAFLHKPSVIIIDEPMVGLDPQSSRLVKDMFKLAAQDGTTVFLSTHSLDTAEELCDRIGIVNNGRLIALGTIDQLRQQAKMEGGNLEDLFLRLTGSPRIAKLFSEN